jgi:hemoglobin
MTTAYEQLGGADGVRALVDRFFELMDSLPAARGIRGLHAKSLKGSREKLFLFLSGWLGGPALYVERYGHPRLRARHLPFPIGDAERDQWMLCMNQALADRQVPEPLRSALSEAFQRTADHMRNRATADPLAVAPGRARD